jgi:hypothetical protein
VRKLRLENDDALMRLLYILKWKVHIFPYLTGHSSSWHLIFFFRKLCKKGMTPPFLQVGIQHESFFFFNRNSSYRVFKNNPARHIIIFPNLVDRLKKKEDSLSKP